ncbi:profilin, required for normal timing of actin polymerization in response to thermal stress [Tritrichomonas musculus]|uniref:Profilin n=1 Tax=Tritrichomonas musculus TaxID=1915356 RepID=A0ABR2JWZ7_9EUKA
MSFHKMTDCLIGQMTGGAIIGFDGGIWASTPGFYGNPMEFYLIAAAFQPQSDAKYKGLQFQGDLYVITSLTDDIIVAQKSSSSLIIAKCINCLVLGYHDEQMPYNECYQAVTELAQILRNPENDSLV